MSDFNGFDGDFNQGYGGGYDDGGYELSYQLQDFSNDSWTESIDDSHLADQAWLNGQTELSAEFTQAAENAEWSSNELYQASWDAWYGPINADGYTAYDASIGYSATDTSFIEPASSAGSCSMISDNSASSFL